MKIGIVGGGPAGLYVALLMKKLDPAHEIRVVEQNPADATYGWGVVFSDVALSYLKDTDADLHDALEGRRIRDELILVHNGRPVAIPGNAFHRIARLELLRMLQERCRGVGVELRFETRVADAGLFADCDLIVGADGVNSVIRQAYREHFRPSLEVRSNKFTWYGTRRRFDPVTLIFREHGDGVFIAHCYRYDETTSTFVVECDAAAWAAASFEAMPDAERLAYCERVFEDDLGGRALLSNRSVWSNFVVVTNRRWSHENVVLLGDALRTAHFSVGSGTRLAMEDAIALARAFEAHGEDVGSALRAFEEARRPIVEEFLVAAGRSIVWYETVRDRMHLEPLAFAYDYMLRTGKLDSEDLRRRYPEFVAAYEASRASPAWPRAAG